MRIISGKYRGHPLVSFKASHIRPTTDKVKESLFNSWSPYLEGARTLDLFSGTGNLGIEALSRGAESVEFVDIHFRSIEILRQNIDKLKIPKDCYRVHKKDVVAWVRSYSGEGFDLIFIDPPFTKKMAHDVMTVVSESAVFGADTQIAIESSAQERIESQYGRLERVKERPFGDKTLSLFQVVEHETSSIPG